MQHYFTTFVRIIPLIFLSSLVWSIEPTVSLQVWANNAIINSFTFNDKNLQTRQLDIAQFFEPQAWKRFSQLNIFQDAKSHHFEVSAVATLPPKINLLENHSFFAEMPIMVTYVHANETITQNLNITIKAIPSKARGTGGYTIAQFESINVSSPCACHSSNQPKVTFA